MHNPLVKMLGSVGNTTNRVQRLQDSIEDLPQETKVDLIPNHYFAPGMYCRELFIPAGVTTVGKVHKHEHITILAEGISAMVSQDGEEVYEAPHIFTSSVGAKRAVHAITDCTWITVHLNPEDKTDIEKIEKEHVVDSIEQLLEDKT